MRDVVIMKETLPSSTKKPRSDLYHDYHEERRQFSKPVFKTPEPRLVNTVKVIEKKPVLNPAAVEEWRALPQRVHKRNLVQNPKPVEQKEKEVPVIKEVKEVKEVPAIKEAQVVKEVPVVKEVEEVKEVSTVKVVKKVPVAKEAPKHNEVAVGKEVKEANATPVVKETANDGKKATEKPMPTVKPNSDGLYELDPVTARVLHEELAQVMIKVWQELPDSPPTDAEEVVADRLRHAAGDDLQNALGLTVTSRLLNIHNPLYVKLHFSGKPEAGCLQSFIREYNVGAFKRIADKYRDTFAARFDDIRDFDKLCAHNEVKCGTATVTINPCYKYLSCPPSIKTIYGVNKDKNKKAVKETPTKYSRQKPDSYQTQKSAQIAVKTVKAEPVAKENKIETKNSDTNKTMSVTTTKTPADIAKAKTSEISKVLELKKATPKKAENKTEFDEKSSDKSKAKGDIDDEMMVVDEMGEEDDEEMTDQDILALMSGGIVLDECSGSDDEK